MTIGGTGFAAGATVTLNGNPAQVRSISGGAISAVTPAAPSGGAVDVVVTNPDGQSARLTRAFTYVVMGRPLITSVSANPGSTEGGAEFRIAGSNFASGARVTFGGAAAPASIVQGELMGRTPAHAAGSVDVTVTNSDGQAATASGAYTYVEPYSLDFNGEWEGHGAEGETALRFTIRDNLLTRVSCGPSLDEPPTVTTVISSTAAVRNGAISFVGSDGAFSGRIVTATLSRGTLRVARCFAADVQWTAQKR